MPYYRSYRKRYSPYRSWRRNGVYRSQVQGTRRFSVAIPIEGNLSIPVVQGQRYSYVFSFQPWYTSSSSSVAVSDLWSKYGNVVNSAVYQIYTRLYDEVKVDSVSLQIAVQGLPSQVNGFKIVSAVDRHFNLRDVFNPPTVATLMGAPESVSKTFTSLQNAKMYRSFYARDLTERTTFTDSSLGTKDVPATQTVPAYQMAGLSDFINDASYAVFVPGISCGFELSAAPAATDPPTSYSVEAQFKVVWKFTFRNPKYGGGSLSKSFEKFSETRAEEIADLKKRSESDSGREVSVLDDDDTLIDAKSEMSDTPAEPTREELLEMLAKYQKTS